MSSVQEDQQAWERHWEVLDRVGLSDYTPDLQWHADVLHRAGGQQQTRPASSIQERRVTPMALTAGGSAGNDRSNGGGGSGSGRGSYQNHMHQSYPLPARFAVAAKSAGEDRGGSNNNNNNNSSGGGGPMNLHPRLRPGLAKQPANRSRQPRLPLESALNLQLIENPEVYVPYQVQTQDWSTSPTQPLLSLEHHEPFGGVAVHAVPRLERPAAPSLQIVTQGGGGTAVAGAVYDSSSGVMDGREDGDGFSSGGGGGGEKALPSLAQSHGGGSGGGGGGGLKGAVVAPLGATVQADSAGSSSSSSSGGGGGGGEGTSSRGVSVVSFRIPLPSVPTAPTARMVPPAVAAVPPALQQPGDRRAAAVSGSSGGASGSVTWGSPAPSRQDGGSQSFVRNEGGQEQQQQHQQPYQVAPAWRPASGAGGSGGLTPHLPPSRKTSADVSYISYSSPPHLQPPPPQHPYFYQQQQQQTVWPSIGRSLSGEPSSAPRFSNAVQPCTTSGPSPRDRYRGILERAGRSAGHKHHERRRYGAAAAAGGSPRLRSRKPMAPGEFGAEMDSNGPVDSSDGGGGGGGGGGNSMLEMASDGLGQWAGRWIQQMTALNMEAKGVSREGRIPSSEAAAGEMAGGNGMRLRAGGANTAVAAPATDGDQNSGQGQNLRNEVAAQRLGIAEHAVWQLRSALDELSRFSCAHAHAGLQGAEVDVSVLCQVDERIQALQKYDKIELGPDGRRTSVIPQPPPPFPLDAAQEYLAAAQSDIAGLEELEEVAASMRKKLQIIVGQDTEDLRRAAAEALAEAGNRRVSEPRVSETCGGGGGSSQIPYPVRRPSNNTPVGTANGFPSRNIHYQNYQLPTANAGGMETQSSVMSYNIPRLTSAPTSLSGLDPGVLGFGDMGASGYIYSQQSTPQPTVSGGAAAAPPSLVQMPHSPPTPTPTQQPPFPSSWNSLPIRKASNTSSTSTPVPSGPVLNQAWALLESLVIQLHDSHASRIDMMDAFSKRDSTDTGSSATAALLAGVTGPMQNHRQRQRRGGGLDRLSGLLNLIDENGTVNSLSEDKEAPTTAAVNGNAVRAAVAATLEPKHTEQALYFLAKLALMLQQDPRLPLEAGFLVSAGVDLLLGEMSWLLAMLRCSSGSGSPHLAVLAAALRAYEMQKTYTTTLVAVAKRLEQAAEDAMDRAAVLERQLAASHTALQRAHHDAVDMQNNVREMERDMRTVKARNQLLEETVADLEGNLDVVETAHAARSVTLQQADQLAGMMLEEHLGRIRLRSKRVQVASEGDCSDPRAIPPVLESTANHYYPITPCVSSRHLLGADRGRKGESSSPTRSGTRKHLGKGHASRKGGLTRAVSRREKRGGGGDGGDMARAAMAAAAAAAALAVARATVDTSEDEDNEEGAAGTDGEGVQWKDGDGATKTRDSASSASRLAVLKRSALRTVSWVDRVPRRGGSSDEVQHRGSAEGRISPVNWAAASAGAAAAGEDASDSDIPTAAVAIATTGGGGGGGKISPRGGRVDGGGGSKISPRLHPSDEESAVAANRSSRDRSRSPTSRPKSSRARKKGSSPDRQKQATPTPTTTTTTQQQSDLQQQQEEEHLMQQQQQLILLEEQQQQSQLRQHGVDGLEYWTQPGAGAGSQSTEDGAEQPRQLEMLQDAALEQAARDMFSDVFEQRQRGGHGPMGRHQ